MTFLKKIISYSVIFLPKTKIFCYFIEQKTHKETFVLRQNC
ncbi:hypothetical protein VVMO6_00455 [Vibrio vulnificus MO6-24/O]|nr:hypothetical protein VVMO6_00455 [Vibrio vulnificus MO6-24/O]